MSKNVNFRVRCVNKGCDCYLERQVVRIPRIGNVLLAPRLMCAVCLREMEIMNTELKALQEWDDE